MTTISAADLKAAALARAEQDDTYRMLLLCDSPAALAEIAGGPIPEGFTFDLFAELALIDEALAQIADDCMATDTNSRA